ncbi:MAG: hypothetical protein WBW33_18220 [Bryobacteraceae bacterium]
MSIGGERLHKFQDRIIPAHTTDPVTFAAVTIVLGLAALLATGVPARKAPVSSL